MQEEYRNIYKTARKSAGLTQEAAAERIAVCVESLRAYETGRTVPPNDVVEQMVVCYNAQHLAYQHLHETNALAARIVPVLEQRSLLEVAVRIYNRMAQFSKNHKVEQLLAMAEDGQIDETERTEFEAIVADLRELIQSGMELELFCRPDDFNDKEGTICPR